MKTIRFIKCATILSCAILLLTQCSQPKEKKPYNVLFLIVDDMNDYGFYEGHPNAKTPYLDEFKETALTFRNAYCASPLCTPSRAATFSGLYPHTTGAYFNGCDPWRQSDILKDSTETLPELFKRNGYTTFGLGKTYHAKLEEGRDTLNWDNKYYGGGFGPFPDKEHQFKGKFWGAQAFPDSAFPDVQNTNATIDFLNKSHDKPFFAALGLWRPHSPFTCPQRFYDMYDVNEIEVPKGYLEGDLDDVDSIHLGLVDAFGRWSISGAKTPDNWKKMLHAYLACNTFADWNIGRVIETLNSSIYANNTIVVFWSDNGYHCGEKNHWEKGSLWEQTVLTPMAIRVPNANGNGKVCTKPVNLVDLYPTLVELCGIRQPIQKIEGVSLTQLIDNPESEWSLPAVTTLGIEYSSVRNEQYRYIRFIDGSEELYDNKKDPYEFNNLAGDENLQSVKDELAKSIPTKWAPELPGRRN